MLLSVILFGFGFRILDCGLCDLIEILEFGENTIRNGVQAF